jgi:glycosyltransferase involved in cell wall biosynthesis
MNPPKISIITACLNRAGMVSTAIESVLAQEYPDFEHIIVDGGSTDGTLDVLDRYPHLKVISERDNGMYDALNKGLKLAQGEIVGFLNSDDCYAPGVFKEVISIFSNTEFEAMAGRAEVFRGDQAGNLETLSQSYPPSPDNLLERTILSNAAFNAWFFQRNIFGKIGAFNSGYRIIGDQEFMIRLAIAGVHFEKTDRLIYQYQRHAGALTFNWTGAHFSEIVQEHLKMTDDFLRKAGLPGQTRQFLRKMRTRDTLIMAIFRLHKLDLLQAWFYMREGIRYDWAWPLKFTFEVLDRLKQAFSRRISHA